MAIVVAGLGFALFSCESPEEKQRRVAHEISQAVGSGNMVEVQELLSNGASATMVNPTTGDSLLHLAAEQNSLEMLALLIERGADVNAKDTEGRTPLCRAACTGNLQMVESLMSHGAVLDDRVFLAAVDACKPEVVKFLIAKGANVLAVDERGNTALHYAAHSIGEITQILLQAGIAPNCVNNEGYTPLMSAASIGNIEVVKTLLAANADAAHRLKDGKPLIVIAVESGNEEVVKALIDAGVATNRGFKIGGRRVNALTYAKSKNMREMLKSAGCVEIISTDAAVKLLKRYEIIDPFAVGKLETDMWTDELKYNNPLKGLSEKFLYEYRLYKDGQKKLNECKTGFVVDIYRAWDLQGSKKHLPKECLLAFIDAGASLSWYWIVETNSGLTKTKWFALDYAAWYGHTDVVEALLDAGANPHDGNPLLYAAKNGRTDIVKLLLDAGVKPQDAQPLYYAAERGNLEIVRMLSKIPGMDVNKGLQDDDKPIIAIKHKPLYAAVNKGRTDVVKYLLSLPDIKVDVEMLHRAAFKGNAEMVKLLMAVPGLKLNEYDGEGTPLLANAVPHLAFKENANPEVLRLLLSLPGIDVNAADDYGRKNTPLMRALFLENDEMVKMLLAAPNIDVNKKDTRPGADSDTPLTKAIRNRNMDIVKLLLAVPGINVNAIGDGVTPLIQAVYRKDIELAKLLLAVPGADVNAEDGRGDTPLGCAVEEANVEFVRFLLATPGIDVHKKNRQGFTPVELITRSFNYGASPEIRQEILNLLYEAMARTPEEISLETHQEDSFPETGNPVSNNSDSVISSEERASLDPLISRMRALRCKHADSALYQKRLLTLLPLIRNGADVNLTLPETKGNTALHYSCAIGSLSITRWLLEHGANPNAVTNKGATPVKCVGSDNRAAIINLLRQYGARQN